MSNLGIKGIDVRQSGTALVFRASLKDSAGSILATGTTTFFIDEIQSDGTIKSYDFNDNTFKTTALTTPTLAGTHRPRNNAGTNTGFWTAALSTLTGFTVGAVYVVYCNNTGASPPQQEREFQYGSIDGDLAITGTPTIGGTGTFTITGAVATQAGTLPITTTTMKADVDTIKTNPVVNAGTVTFQNGTLPITTSVMDGNLTKINGTSIAGTGTRVADVFTSFFNVTSATGTANSLPAAIPGAAGGVFIAGSNAATTTAGFTFGAISATTITASGAVAFQSTFVVTTSTNLGALSCSTFAASGTVTFNALTVTNATTFSGAVNFNSAVGFTSIGASGNVVINGNFRIDGTTTLTGAVHLGSDLLIAGDMGIAGNFVVTNAFQINGATSFNGGTLFYNPAGTAIQINGVNGYGIQLWSTNNAIDVYSSNGNALYLQANANDGVAIYGGYGTYKGVRIFGGTSGGDAVSLESNTSGAGGLSIAGNIAVTGNVGINTLNIGEDINLYGNFGTNGGWNIIGGIELNGEPIPTQTKVIRLLAALARDDGNALVDLATEAGEINGDFGHGTGGWLQSESSYRALRSREDIIEGIVNSNTFGNSALLAAIGSITVDNSAIATAVDNLLTTNHGGAGSWVNGGALADGSITNSTFAIDPAVEDTVPGDNAFLSMMVWLANLTYRRKRIKNKTAGTTTLLKADGTTLAGTMAYTTSVPAANDTNETMGPMV